MAMNYDIEIYLVICFLKNNDAVNTTIVGNNQRGTVNGKCNQIHFLMNLTADYRIWTISREFGNLIKSPPLSNKPESNYRFDHVMTSINTI